MQILGVIIGIALGTHIRLISSVVISWAISRLYSCSCVSPGMKGIVERLLCSEGAWWKEKINRLAHDAVFRPYSGICFLSVSFLLWLCFIFCALSCNWPATAFDDVAWSNIWHILRPHMSHDSSARLWPYKTTNSVKFLLRWDWVHQRISETGECT